MSVIAKFKVSRVVESKFDGGYGHTEVFLNAITDKSGIPEDQQFAKFTPNGEIKMTIDNPAALEQFKPGEICYVSFDGFYNTKP